MSSAFAGAAKRTFAAMDRGASSVLKIAGMSSRSVKATIAIAQKPSSPGGARVARAEAKAIALEVKEGGVSAGERKAVKDLFDSGAIDWTLPG